QGAQFAFSVERVLTPDAVVPSRVSLGWYAGRDEASPAPQVHAGERWEVSVRLRRPHGYVNGAGFDLEAWLLEHGLRATGYVRADAAPTRIDAFAGRPGDYVQRARERVRARILAALPDAPYAGVLVALAIGDQRAIPESQWQTFNRTGVSHLISISGLHVTAFATLAAGAILLLARRIIRLTSRIPARKVALAGGVLFAFAYVLLAGAEVPAMRTLAMLCVAAVGLWLARPGTSSVVWLWSLAAVLLLDPWASFAPGFWLSFGAVGLLLYAGSGRIGERRGGSRIATLQGALREGAHAQWVVTVGLVPGTLALFQQVSLVSVVANAVAIPAVTFGIVPLALAGIALPIDLPWRIAHTALVPLMKFLEYLATWPAATWASHAPPGWVVAVAMIGIVWLLAPRGMPGRVFGVCWLAPLALVKPLPPSPGEAVITVLDVGQGLAVVVRTATHALVYDTGARYGPNADAGGRIIAPFLRASGITHLDALVVSHQDLDHSGGAASLLATVPVGTFVSSLRYDHELMLQARRSAQTLRCVAGQQWDWDGVRFTVLHPPPANYGVEGLKTNDLSCVLRIDAARASALVTGDIEARSEADLLRYHPAWLAANVLVVPHHGSRTSSTASFVATVHPADAVFANGYRNRFGHPRADIVQRYADHGARLWRTDYDGALTFIVGGDAPVVARSARWVDRRYWYDAP
ncbi:MAG TPA: DNA internalization-related competence protein ComEC/Rec2, partial [Casimicrobiaceae bacterium]|nr:DNA internalization-related competence protein ComEC/Rec2 [Casimicrobiaceae bacterium]